MIKKNRKTNRNLLVYPNCDVAALGGRGRRAGHARYVIGAIITGIAVYQCSVRIQRPARARAAVCIACDYIHKRVVFMEDITNLFGKQKTSDSRLQEKQKKKPKTVAFKTVACTN